MGLPWGFPQPFGGRGWEMRVQGKLLLKLPRPTSYFSIFQNHGLRRERREERRGVLKLYTRETKLDQKGKPFKMSVTIEL